MVLRSELSPTEDRGVIFGFVCDVKAGPLKAEGFEVQIGDDQQVFVGPVQGARRQGDEMSGAEGEGVRHGRCLALVTGVIKRSACGTLFILASGLWPAGSGWRAARLAPRRRSAA